jgi:hypothetical protein
MTLLDERFRLRYHADEIQLELVRGNPCLSPGSCDCREPITDTPKCSYSAQEAKAQVIAYYEKRLEQLKNQTIFEFLDDQGFYR